MTDKQLKAQIERGIENMRTIDTNEMIAQAFVTSWSGGDGMRLLRLTYQALRDMGYTRESKEIQERYRIELFAED